MISRHLTLAFVLTVSVTLNAADCTKCDCSHWPWKDVCGQCCSLKVFNNSSSEELHKFLNLDDSSKDKMSTITANGTISSLDQLKTVIGNEKMDQIDKQIQSLAPVERQYLVLSPSQKVTFHEKIMMNSEASKPSPQM